MDDPLYVLDFFLNPDKEFLRDAALAMLALAVIALALVDVALRIVINKTMKFCTNRRPRERERGKK